MVHNDRLVVVSIIALLSTWFQDGSTRPLPAEEHSSMGSWLDYFQEVEAPEWPQYSEIPSEWHPYADMPIRSGPEPTQFHYADIPVPYPVNEHQSTGSSHGLDFQHITNTYHHPSSSHTVVDHHFNIPSEQNFSSQIPGKTTMPTCEQYERRMTFFFFFRLQHYVGPAYQQRE
jgi:hypothetical protein